MKLHARRLHANRDARKSVNTRVCSIKRHVIAPFLAIAVRVRHRRAPDTFAAGAGLRTHSYHPDG
ncbi:hypothetical protein SAMN05216550_105308 [Paraburkholderia tropica]|jgi:hypothetical protein|uniref:Uncharacterized protein n=1 Tax=Paraburkholderia tropica TaxID=92647 RepID=A0AAQ1JTP8_9BURK|nr:hypothetical protein SAMN05216550_105308 [Paraburkholderia tropica]